MKRKRLDFAALTVLDDAYEMSAETRGAGTFGEVRMGTRKMDNMHVAIKKLRPHRKFDVLAQREIYLMMELNHPNILSLIDVATKTASKNALDEQCVYLVLERMDCTLQTVMESERFPYYPGQYPKTWLQQLLRGVGYLHSRGVLHRDIKPENILMKKQGVLKLCDFGLSRTIKRGAALTLPVATVNYRAPEILLGDSNYAFASDVWSIGCIAYHFVCAREMIQVYDEGSALRKIFELIGTPTEHKWHAARRMPFYSLASMVPPGGHARFKRDLEKLYREESVDIVVHALMLNPSERYTCKTLLSEKYFTTEPLPINFDR